MRSHSKNVIWVFARLSTSVLTQLLLSPAKVSRKTSELWFCDFRRPGRSRGVTALHHFAGRHSLVSDALFRAVRLDLMICGSPVNRNSSTPVKGNLRSAVVGQAYDAPPSTVSSWSGEHRDERRASESGCFVEKVKPVLRLKVKVQQLYCCTVGALGRCHVSSIWPVCLCVCVYLCAQERRFLSWLTKSLWTGLRDYRQSESAHSCVWPLAASVSAACHGSQESAFVYVSSQVLHEHESCSST